MRRIFTQLLLLFVIIFAAKVEAETNYAKRADVQAFITKMVNKHHLIRGD